MVRGDEEEVVLLDVGLIGVLGRMRYVGAQVLACGSTSTAAGAKATPGVESSAGAYEARGGVDACEWFVFLDALQLIPCAIQMLLFRYYRRT
jgi:hypothetical protein